MKRKLLILSFLSVLLSHSIIAQTNIKDSAVLDALQITLEGPDGFYSPAESAYLYVDNRATDAYDLMQKAGDPADIQLKGYWPHMFGVYCFIYEPQSVEEVEKRGPGAARLALDNRPYNGKYYMDFPLYIELNKVGRYSFTARTRPNDGNEAAVFFRFIDYAYPEKFIDILRDGYSVEITKTELDAPQTEEDRKMQRLPGNYTRFAVRVYAGALLKKDAVDSDWTNANNWIGGVPGEGKDARVDNCVFIPDDVDIVIPAGKNYKIGALLNAGNLIIEDGAVLEVDYEAKLGSLNEIY